MKRISRIIVCSTLLGAPSFLLRPAAAEPIGPQWPQPGGQGTAVFITYSYANLFDGSFLLLSPDELRAATEEALALWAQFAPLHFMEQVDSGPPPSDSPYDGTGTPQIRLGLHPMSELAHAFFPSADGLGGDMHFDPGTPWTLGVSRWNFLEAVTHELGHALGLAHIEDKPAIMNSFYPQQRFSGLGSAFLFPADIEGVQALYGAGRGSIQPLPAIPEPSSILLVGVGMAMLARSVRRRRGQSAGLS